MTISPLDFTSLSDVSEPPEAGVEEPPPPEPPPQAVRASASPARAAASAERREWRRFMADTFFFRLRRQASHPPGPASGDATACNAWAKTFYFAIIRGPKGGLKQAEWGRSPTAATTHPPNVRSGRRHSL